MTKKARRQFSVRIESEETFFVEEIWPDGDAPENPTVEDVRKALFGEKAYRYDVRRALEDWGMLDFDPADVTITDETAFVQRMLDLKAKAVP